MRIVLGVSGGIAAYKAAELARALIRDNHQVQVVMTRAAEEFIRPLTFASLTGRKVITEIFAEDALSASIEHISIARENDLLLVAPATANTLAKFASGLADDFLSTLYLAFTGPVILAPAMNNEMWAHAATQANINTLRARGHRIVEPADGYLACGTYGPGRLAETHDIAAAVSALNTAINDLKGETVLITAGPTREAIDPVRFISNRSSGKMGYALADAAASRGARVILVSGPVNLQPPHAVEVIAVETAEQMRAAVFANLESATIVIKCAAVSDYRPAAPAAQKIKKTNAPLTLALEPVPDILGELGARKGSRRLVGFAAETEDLVANAQAKLSAKNCDLIVANSAREAFDSDTNAVTLIAPNQPPEELARASKREIADRILGRVKR